MPISLASTPGTSAYGTGTPDQYQPGMISNPVPYTSASPTSPYGVPRIGIPDAPFTQDALNYGQYLGMLGPQLAQQQFQSRVNQGIGLGASNQAYQQALGQRNQSLLGSLAQSGQATLGAQQMLGQYNIDKAHWDIVQRDMDLRALEASGRGGGMSLGGRGGGGGGGGSQSGGGFTDIQGRWSATRPNDPLFSNTSVYAPGGPGGYTGIYSGSPPTTGGGSGWSSSPGSGPWPSSGSSGVNPQTYSQSYWDQYGQNSANYNNTYGTGGGDSSNLAPSGGLQYGTQAPQQDFWGGSDGYSGDSGGGSASSNDFAMW